MLKSEKELTRFYHDKISAESKTIGSLPAFGALPSTRNSGIKPDAAKNLNSKRTARTELVSALVAITFASFCLELIPVYPYRHFDRSMQIFSEVKIESQQMYEFAQAVSLSFNLRKKN